MDQTGSSQGVLVDDALSVERYGRLDGDGHLVGELVRMLQQLPGDLRDLFCHLCLVTIRSLHDCNLAGPTGPFTVPVHN